MNGKTLEALEQAIEPYRHNGFVVKYQSESAITLSPPAEKFSYVLFFITLILFWPIAVAYLIIYNNRKNKEVCVRVTSQGYIEETGYTLQALAKERKRVRWLLLITMSIPIFLVLAILLLRFRLW